MGIFLTLVIFGTALIYVRHAPSKPVKWHIEPAVFANKVLPGGVRRVIPVTTKELAEFETIALQDPNTERLAGSVESGMITFISRSKIVGFPDYTTVHQVGDELQIYGRSRFGRKDFGVNAARVDRWVNALPADQA